MEPDLERDNTPDPFPGPGVDNRGWAEMLLAVILSTNELDRVAYLERALTIACMYSTRPKDRFLDALVAKLERASSMIESVSYPGSSGIEFVKECNDLIRTVRSYKNGT